MGKQWKQRQTLFFWAPKSLQMVTAAMKLKLLLGSKAMTNLDSILKSRDITFPTNIHLIKAMIYPVVMYGYESWTIKKAESWGTDVFELWYWRRLLRVSWTARRSNAESIEKVSFAPLSPKTLYTDIPPLPLWSSLSELCGLLPPGLKSPFCPRLCLFNLYAEYIRRNDGLDEAQAGLKIAGRNINNLRYADDTTLMAESEELKSPLMKVKAESEKAG